MVVMVYITAGDVEEAKKIARVVIRKRLAACANIIGGITSIYRWKGRVEEESEAILLLKTSKAMVNALIDEVKELHSYEVPDITVIPVKGGLEEYLMWIKEETRSL